MPEFLDPIDEDRIPDRLETYCRAIVAAYPQQENLQETNRLVKEVADELGVQFFPLLKLVRNRIFTLIFQQPSDGPIVMFLDGPDIHEVRVFNPSDQSKQDS